MQRPRLSCKARGPATSGQQLRESATLVSSSAAKGAASGGGGGGSPEAGSSPAGILRGEGGRRAQAGCQKLVASEFQGSIGSGLDQARPNPSASGHGRPPPRLTNTQARPNSLEHGRGGGQREQKDEGLGLHGGRWGLPVGGVGSCGMLWKREMVATGAGKPLLAWTQQRHISGCVAHDRRSRPLLLHACCAHLRPPLCCRPLTVCGLVNKHLDSKAVVGNVPGFGSAGAQGLPIRSIPWAITNGLALTLPGALAQPLQHC